MNKKIKKALKKLSPDEYERAKKIFEQLGRSNFAGLDVRKLKGYEDVFRIRKGDLRILYRFQDGAITVLDIRRRSEKTYK